MRRLNTWCSELQSVWISDGAIVAYSYDLKVVSKSNYQSKPRLYSLKDVTILTYDKPHIDMTADTEQNIGGMGHVPF
jgi:hypothetical protein